MRFRFPVLVSSVFIAGLLSVSQSDAGIASFSSGAGGSFNVPVVSLKEARFKTVIKQQYDFSCGSAALATLLKFHYDTDTDEQSVFKAMYDVGDQAKIKKLGFSLLDMKKFLQSIDLKADGFKLTLEKLRQVGVPAIALVETSGYKHFVVVKGIRGNEVVLGDPAMGVRVLGIPDFEKIWNGIAFLIRNKASVGKESFNQEEDWSVRIKAPFGTSLSRQSLASFTVHLPLNPF
tara:strand:+ start:273 stop:971 length:699 start_codon:yes stop_codon:yes gene_type:complete